MQLRSLNAALSTETACVCSFDYGMSLWRSVALSILYRSVQMSTNKEMLKKGSVYLFDVATKNFAPRLDEIELVDWCCDLVGCKFVNSMAKCLEFISK